MLPCGLTPRAVDARVLYMSPSSKNRSACLEPYAASSLTEVYDRLVAPHLDAQIDSWLAEDLGEDGDLTTDAFVPPDVEARAELCCREPGILSGLPVVMRMLQLRGGPIRCEALAVDGDELRAGDRVLELVGPLATILPLERTMLNLLGRLSGVATTTRRYVDAVKSTNAHVVDTRKTTPGLRRLEKYAVRCGGGRLHRIGLFDGVLVKDNHLGMLEQAELAMAVETAALAARETSRALFVEIEVDDHDQLKILLGLPEGTIDAVLLDNMEPLELARAVAMRDTTRPEMLLEASGGVRLDTIQAIAETGVDRIAVGAITHSAVQVDFGLDLK